MKRLSILFFTSVIIIIAACSDDDTFTVLRNNPLSFSTDILRLDAAFSNVSTSTKVFWVYSRSGDGLRLTSVRLAQGSQTGFRVSVNDVELSATNGYRVGDLKVRNKDSIQIFVEMTSPFNNAATPQEIVDNLLFILESGVQQKVNLRVYSWDAELVKGRRITSSTTLTSIKPIVFQSTLKVEASAILTISAGTTVYFSQKAAFDVYGALHCEGTVDNPVTLRGDRLDKMFKYLPYDRVNGRRQGVRFHRGNYDNVLTHTDIHSTYNGIFCDTAAAARTKLTIANSTAYNCQDYGLQAINNKVVAYNSQFSNILVDYTPFVGGEVTLTHCTFTQFYPFDSNRGTALNFDDHIDNKDYPLQTFHVVNSPVTDYADDVLTANNKEDVTANYHSYNCVLRTPKPKETTLLANFTDVIWENSKDYPDGGPRQFLLVDGNKQKYDFHLKKIEKGEKYPAIDTGLSLGDTCFATDHDGKQRDSKPDIGCYELIAN